MPDRPSTMPDAIVVGGGVIGCAAAYFLASEGARVTLLERGAVAGGSSGAAAGMLAPIGAFGQSEAVERRGLESLSQFPALCADLQGRTGIDPEFVESGLLRLAASAGESASLRGRMGELNATQPELALEWLSHSDVRAAEPQLSPASFGALWSPHEAHVNSSAFVRALAAAATSLGAVVEVGVSVHGLLRSGERITGVRSSAGDRSAGHVVVCGGCWTAELSNWLSESGAARVPTLPIHPVRGQILALEAPSPPLRSIVFGPDAYLVPQRDGAVLVGATEELEGFDARVTAEGLGSLLAAASELVPALARATFRDAWAGLRPGSPDGLPGIGTLEGFTGLSLAAGHFRNGILLAPLTGRLTSDIVLGKAAPADLADFDPGRWNTAQPFI